MNKKTYKFRFPEVASAEKFVSIVNKETDGYALHPFNGNHADREKRTVLVKRTGSLIFDLKLKDRCIEVCEALGGVLVE